MAQSDCGFDILIRLILLESDGSMLTVHGKEITIWKSDKMAKNERVD